MNSLIFHFKPIKEQIHCIKFLLILTIEFKVFYTFKIYFHSKEALTLKKNIES